MFDPVKSAADRIRTYGVGGSVLGKLTDFLRTAPEAATKIARATEPVVDKYTATGRTIPRDDRYERLQALVSNQPTEAGNYQWAVVKPGGQVHGAPFDFKGSALHVADGLNQQLPGHTVQALSVDAPEISRFVPRTPNPEANPFKKATAEDIDQLLSGQPGMAEGGEVLSVIEKLLSLLRPAGKEVSGYAVREKIPNLSSIGASFNNHQSLPGIHEVPFSAFDLPPDWKPRPYSVSESNRLKALTSQMGDSKEVNPLIVAVDEKGPYILEGGHRFDALRNLGAPSFPAHVVFDLDSLGVDSIPGHAKGGEVEDDGSLAKISAFLKRYGGPHAQRLGVGIAKQLYGLDEHGNPVLGGQVSAHPVHPAILDQFAALPASLIPLANAISAGGPKEAGNADIPTPQWSQDAAARLAALEKRIQQTTGVGEAQSLPEHLEDAAAMLATPLPAAKVAKEAPTLQRILEMLTPVRPPTLGRYAGDTAIFGGASTALDALTRRLAEKPSLQPVDPEFEQAAFTQTNTHQPFAAGGSVQDTRINWSGPLYLPPRGNKEKFAQCGTCIHFLKKTGQCYLLRPQDHITAEMSCSFYAQGTPATKGTPVGRYTPTLAGLVDRAVRCENCRFFDTETESKVHCDLFTQLDRAFPKIFKLDRYVDAYGCCNMQTPGERSPDVFKPTGPIGEQKEPT